MPFPSQRRPTRSRVHASHVSFKSHAARAASGPARNTGTQPSDSDGPTVTLAGPAVTVSGARPGPRHPPAAAGGPAGPASLSSIVRVGHTRASTATAARLSGQHWLPASGLRVTQCQAAWHPDRARGQPECQRTHPRANPGPGQARNSAASGNRDSLSDAPGPARGPLGCGPGAGQQGPPRPPPALAQTDPPTGPQKREWGNEISET
jgi:hypothetical protein